MILLDSFLMKILANCGGKLYHSVKDCLKYRKIIGDNVFRIDLKII